MNNLNFNGWLIYIKTAVVVQKCFYIMPTFSDYKKLPTINYDLLGRIIAIKRKQAENII
jgi:hypothetical protein